MSQADQGELFNGTLTFYIGGDSGCEVCIGAIEYERRDTNTIDAIFPTGDRIHLGIIEGMISVPITWVKVPVERVPLRPKPS